MKQFYLTEINTKDKLIHQGLFFASSQPKKTAFLWIHGLGSTFYSQVALLEAFAKTCERNGYGFAAFNNRGHDGVTGLKKVDPQNDKGYSRLSGGAGYEVFEECVYDIEAGIVFLIRHGFSKIVLAGHSTGANKLCYYAGNQNDSRVAGVVLVSPMSDRLNPQGKPPWWAQGFAKP